VTPRSPMVVGVALLAVATAALGAQVLRPHPRRAPVAGASGASADALFRDVARSLSPLVHSAKELAKLTSEVRSGSTPAPAVNQIAQGWETDFATSRDLVGRLPLAAAAPVERPRTLYQLGAALYVESARAVPRLVAAAGDPAARSVALKRVSRISAPRRPALRRRDPPAGITPDVSGKDALDYAWAFDTEEVTPS
jgi:hypothetical protein